MPRGHGRIGSNFENVAYRRSHPLFRRSSDQNNYNLSSKEPQISVLVLRNSEQRCIIFTLVALELDAYWKLATFLPSLQGPEWRNQLGSGAHSEVDGLESISPPAIMFPVDLQKEQRINFPEGTSSPKSSSVCSSSRTDLLRQSRNRNKRAKSVKSSSCTLPSCLVLDNSSGSLCDGLSAVGSDALVNDVPNVDKPVKKGSRKKGKKKRKQYKQSTHNKVSFELERQCEESICGASVVETSVNCDPTCSGESISENNLSEKATCHSLSVKDITIEKDKYITIEKDDRENNNDYTDSSTTLMSGISYNDEIDEHEPCEPVASLPQGFAGEEFSCNNSTDLNSTSSTKPLPEKMLPTVDLNIKNAHSEQNIISNDNSSGISLNQYDDAPMLDSFQHGWSISISKNCSDDVETRLSVKDEGRVNCSGGMISDSRYYDSSFHRTTVNSCVIDNLMSSDCHCGSKDIVDTHSSPESSPCSSQACSSNDFHPVVSGKRGRTSRKVAARTGKDNNPVWQKVQKMDTEHCIYEPKNANDVSGKVSVSSKDSDTRARLNTFMGLKQNQRGKTSRYPCSHEMVSQTSKTCSFKVASSAIDLNEINVNRKPSSASKQADHYYRKGSHNGNNKIARPSEIHVQQKEGLKILPHVIHNKHISTGLSPPCSTDSPQLMVKPINSIDFCQSEQQKIREHMDEATSVGNICSSIREMTSLAAYNRIGPSTTELDSSNHTHIKVHSDISDAEYCKDMHDAMDDEDSQCRKSHTDSFHVDSFGPVLQKWVPVGRKDSVVSNTSHIDNLTTYAVNKEVPNKLDIKNADGEVSSEAEVEVSSDAYHFLPSVGGRLQCLNPSDEEIDCSSHETDKLTGKLRSHPRTTGEFVGVPTASNCQSIHEVKDQGYSGFETDLDMIIQAVDDAHTLQTAEGIHLVTGSFIADFEIFIGSASPVISQRYHSRSCKTCSPEQLTSNSLCLHQIPNISLRSLWQWYEEPGCYGLQVKAEDHCNSKRLQKGCSEFSAYFVPYLSGVQLFGRSGTSNVSSNGEVMISCEVDKTSKSSSDLGSLPIFSMLLPQPREEVDVCLLASSSAKKKFINQSIRGTNLGDGELIFEHFEDDQPPQRRPLFEKIKQLIRGETSSNCQIYGDPSKLESLNLHDLHPASWYSVAWYPIYRIPEGNFRAAFLTYHSLGHFIQQSPSSNMDSDFTRIVSPVVGLQSYNAKRECWFQLRGSKSKVIQTEEASRSRPEILEKRLRTLEHTASVMSTTSVCKGNQRSVNKHPDYNHFYSRW